MSNKSSPPSRSARTSPAVSRRRSRQSSVDPAVRAPAAERVPTTMKERVRHYLPFIGVPNLVLVLGIIAVCLAAILLTGGRLAALSASIAQMWFVVHGVPVTFQGVTLGAVPLLPAIGVAALIAWRVRVATRERVSILDLYAICGLVVLIPFTLSAIAWFMVSDATAVFPVAPPAIHKALLIPVFVHVVGLACGMSGRLWKALLARIGAPEALFDATRAVVHLSLRLAGVAAVVYLVLLTAGYSRLGDLLDQFPVLGAGGGVALFLLGVLYLPNAALSTLAVLLGAPFDIAQGGVSLFGASLVPLPPFPLFAAIPGEVPVWAPVLLAVPAAVMIHFVLPRRLGWVEILIAAAFAAVLAAFAGLMSGGDVGAYGWIGPDPWFFALASALWVVVVAGAAWLVAQVLQSRKQSQQQLEEQAEQQDRTESMPATTSDAEAREIIEEETEEEPEGEPEEKQESEEDQVIEEEEGTDEEQETVGEAEDEDESETEAKSDGAEDVDKPAGSTAISVLRAEQLD